MITVYATVQQFLDRHPPSMLGSRTTADVPRFLADASGLMDDYFRGRYPLPFVAVGPSVSRKCVDWAWYLFMGGRGFSPVTESDRQIVADYEAAEAWCDRVQRRALHPDVTVSANVDDLAQPVVFSQSVVDMNGRTAPNRGW